MIKGNSYLPGRPVEQIFTLEEGLALAPEIVHF